MADEEGATGQALVQCAQQPPDAAIGEHAAAVKASEHFAPALMGGIGCDTVSELGVCSWVAFKLLIRKVLLQFHTSLTPLLRATPAMGAALYAEACGSETLTGGGA
jgi:hypothetical protein